MPSKLLDDVYRTFPYIIYGQLFALLTSLKVKNRPDTPSPTGTVNRVVQGVVIHPFAKQKKRGLVVVLGSTQQDLSEQDSFEKCPQLV